MRRLIEQLRDLGSKSSYRNDYSDELFVDDGKKFIKTFSAQYSFISGFADGINPVPNGMAFRVNGIYFIWRRDWSRQEAALYLSEIYSNSIVIGRTELKVDAVGLGGSDIRIALMRWDDLINEDRKPFV